MLPKNSLQMVVSQQTDIPAHASNTILSNSLVPIPTTAYVLKNPDARFEESEKFTFRIANYMSNNLDKSQRKVIRRLGGMHSHALYLYIYDGLCSYVHTPYFAHNTLQNWPTTTRSWALSTMALA